MIAAVRISTRDGKVSRLSRRQRNERGSVLTEFVMVAPVMLLIAGSALRFYQELQAREIGIAFTREVATLAYNRCIDKTSTAVKFDPATNQEQVTGNGPQTLGQIGDCIQTQVLAKFIKSWDIVKPITTGTDPLTITVEAYRCDIEQISQSTEEPPPTICSKIGKVTCTQTSAHSSSSACTPTDTDNSQELSLSPLRNRKVIARIEFTMRPLATFIPSIESRSVTYEATV